MKLDASFGAYKAEWSYENGTLTFVHELEIRDAVVPAADYLGVREFFEAVASAQASAVVLLNR